MSQTNSVSSLNSQTNMSLHNNQAFLNPVPYYVMRRGYLYQTDLIKITPAFSFIENVIDWVERNCPKEYSSNTYCIIDAEEYKHLPNLN